MPKPAVRVHRNAALKIKKEPAPKPPNMPHHNLPEPYARMLNMDEKEPDETFEKIAEELKAGNADKAVQKLIEMALDESYYEYYHDYPDYDDYLKRETRMMMPTHAVHVLTYMGAAGLAAMEPLLPLLNCEDDFQREELPIFYGAMGEAAIEPLIGVLKEGNSEEYLRGGAGEGLVAIAEAHPELRDRVVGILENALANEKEDDELNGFLICNLLDLKAVESYLIIEKAYEDDLVDESIVGLRDVQEHFGLPMTAEDSGIRWVHESELHKPDPALPYQSALDDDEEPAAQPYVAAEKPGRNDPCHCGSGKKYKKCHGA